MFRSDIQSLKNQLTFQEKVFNIRTAKANMKNIEDWAK